MIETLLSREVEEFIRLHESDDPQKLLLKFRNVGGVPIKNVVDQIVGRKKAKEKFPSLYDNARIIYPHTVNLEQASSEKTAEFKTAIIKSLNLNDYRLAVDLTGGFGIDTFLFGKSFEHVFYVEPDVALSQIVKHNHAQLGQTNISYYETTAEEFLRKEDSYFDLVYIDPSRRKSDARKVFRFSDCEPDITKLTNLIFDRSDNLVIKASPLLDIQQGIKELKFVKHVYVVSLNNECKELLFVCQKNFNDEAMIEAVNIEKEQVESFRFHISNEKILTSVLNEPLTYLYEPNTSILKAGAFKSIAAGFGLMKLHPNTHLYTSEDMISSFPGKIFKIKTYTKADQKILKKYLPEMKANISLRNYPMTVAELKKKANVIEGGEKYLIGFSGMKKKYLVIADRIS
ncbi:MAG TPA: SAM-dependent methyltransferase [Cyclobacteriaceae bacterium]|nr:SAM-dependent methyltransferase [Cyclobacteriaceae bacterium]